MVFVSENRHDRSLDFGNERKVVIMRDQGYTFPQIRKKVLNRKGKRPGLRTTSFSGLLGRPYTLGEQHFLLQGMLIQNPKHMFTSKC